MKKRTQDFSFKDRIVTRLYSFYIFLKGYKVKKVESPLEKIEIEKLIHEVHVDELGWVYSEEIEVWNTKVYEKAISFIVYHRGKTVGTMSLIDPNYANRLYEGYGLNENKSGFEIGGLAVKKEYRSKDMLVFSMLFSTAFFYSKNHGIKYWLALSSRLLYRNLLKLDPSTKLLKHSTENGKTDVGIRYHDSAREVNPGHVCYQMTVDSYSPWSLAKYFLKKRR